jgi:hypothetical protein
MTPNPRTSKQPKPKRLLDFKEWYQPVHEAVQRGIHVLQPESDDATVVITASTLLEKLLEFAVVLHFGPMPSMTDMRLLFDYPGPLSSFSAKINLCAALGIITPQVRKDLDLIRDTRNRFCHTLFKKSFEDSDIAKNCAGMHWGLESNELKFAQIEKGFSRFGSASRIRFTFTCIMVATILIYMFIRKYHELKAAQGVQEEAHKAAREIFDTKLDELVSSAAVSRAGKTGERVDEETPPHNPLVVSIRESIEGEIQS